MGQVKIGIFGKILYILPLASGSLQAMEPAHTENKDKKDIQVFYNQLVASNPACQSNSDKKYIVYTYLRQHAILLLSKENLIIPTEIGSCKKLQELNLPHNQLTSFPTEIRCCTKLRELYLFDNQLASIPTEIGYCTALKILDLSDNLLTTIPTEIGSCKKLQELNLPHNQLTSFPTEIGSCKKLQILNLSQNPQLASLFGSKWSTALCYNSYNSIGTFRQWYEEIVMIKNYMLLMNPSTKNSQICLPKELINFIFGIMWELHKESIKTIKQ